MTITTNKLRSGVGSRACRLGLGAFALGVLSMAVVNTGAQADENGAGLARYRNKNRLAIVFAPSASDTRYTSQLEKFAGKDDHFRERDLLRFSVFAEGQSKRGDDPLSTEQADALRHRFGVSKEQFKFVLVGKDGHTAYSYSHPVSSSQLFGLIDAMPMRREEMRRQGKTGKR